MIQDLITLSGNGYKLPEHREAVQSTSGRARGPWGSVSEPLNRGLAEHYNEVWQSTIMDER